MLLGEIVLLVDIPLQRRENASPFLQRSPTLTLDLAQLVIRQTGDDVRTGQSALFGDTEILQFFPQDNDGLFSEEQGVLRRVDRIEWDVGLRREQARGGFCAVEIVLRFGPEIQDVLETIGVELSDQAGAVVEQQRGSVENVHVVDNKTKAPARGNGEERKTATGRSDMVRSGKQRCCAVISLVPFLRCAGPWALTSTVKIPSSPPSQLAGLLRMRPCGNSPSKTLSGRSISISLSTGKIRPRKSRFRRDSSSGFWLCAL